jgi:hypothetical protein
MQNALLATGARSKLSDSRQFCFPRRNPPRHVHQGIKLHSRWRYDLYSVWTWRAAGRQVVLPRDGARLAIGYRDDLAKVEIDRIGIGFSLRARIQHCRAASLVQRRSFLGHLELDRLNMEKAASAIFVTTWLRFSSVPTWSRKVVLAV